MNDDDEALGIITAVGIAITVLVGAVLFFNAPARGHSWYDAYCCSGQDCAPVDEKRVRIVTGGYLLDGKYFIPEKDARNSQDGDYHACFWPNPDTLRCFYRPPMGF
jgi:hypothetical protein